MKTFKVTYFMYPAENIEITIRAETEEKAMEFAKEYRSNSYTIEEVKEVNE